MAVDCSHNFDVRSPCTVSSRQHTASSPTVDLVDVYQLWSWYGRDGAAVDRANQRHLHTDHAKSGAVLAAKPLLDSSQR